MTFISVFILSLFLTVVLIPIFIRLAIKANAYDMPDARKVHQWPVPRIGGIAMAIGTFIPILIWSPLGTSVRAYLAGALVIVVFGLIDDLKGLSFKAKFAGQIAAVVIAILYGDIRIVKLGVLLPDGVILADWVSSLLTLVAFVGVTNAINLSDGLDGLAGGICMLSFCCIGYLAFLEQNFAVAIPAVALVGAIFGFLRFNTFPATLFMGDTGSQLLGFSAIYFSLALTQGDTALSPLLPLIILGFPVLDTLTVMGERIAQGRSPFAADKNHFHHRLMRMGMFHTESVFFIYVIQALLIVSAFVLRFYSEWLLLVSYLIFAGLVLAFFHWADATGWKLPRFYLIDRAIKGRLRVLREKGFFIKVTFKFLEFGAPLFLVLLCFLPADVPPYFSISSAILAALFGMVWIFRREWAKGFLMLVLYAFIPLVIYITETGVAPWMNNFLMNLYKISFLLLAVLCFITLRLTRRKRGFKLTPMDFLVLFISLGLFVVPDLRAQFGSMAMKTIILFFTYEIILGEVREKVGKVALVTVTAFVIVAVRGVVG